MIIISINIVETAFISGVIPNLTIEYILTGKVTLFGPDVKNVTTKSSSDNVNASKKEAIIAGLRKGKTISLITWKLLAPKSIPASSISLFRIESLDLIMIAMIGNMNDTWAIIIVDKDKGHISKLGQFIKLKNANIDTPMHISGIIIGKSRAKS